MFCGYSHPKRLPDKILPPETAMKKLSFCILLSLLLFSARASLAGNVGLSSTEVQALFADVTVTVEDAEAQSRDGEDKSFKAFFSKMGGARAIYPDGAATSYSWSVDEKGRVCFARMKRKTAICGFMMAGDDGNYHFYTSKKTSKNTIMRKDRPIKDKGWKLASIFKEFQAGDQL